MRRLFLLFLHPKLSGIATHYSCSNLLGWCLVKSWVGRWWLGWCAVVLRARRGSTNIGHWAISGSTLTDLRAFVICSIFLYFLRWQIQLRRYNTTIATPAQVAISTKFRLVSPSDEILTSPKFFWSVFFISPSAAVCELAEPPMILEFQKLNHQ